MKTVHNKIYQIIFTAIVLCSLASCSKDDDATPVTPLTATLVSDLPADPTVSTTGATLTSTKKFTLFSFKNNATVANSDSASANWDIGFRSTTLIVNSGISGPGAGAGQITSGIFDELLVAPSTGYKQDSTGGYALAGASWYNYTGTTSVPNNAIIPIPGKILIVKTADGKYVKLEILSYYLGNPNTTTDAFASLDTRPAARYYTFRFIYQADGTTNLATN